MLTVERAGQKWFSGEWGFPETVTATWFFGEEEGRFRG
jgi:hypothetical protein